MTANHSQPLVIERTLNAPATQVWQALTDEKALKEWNPIFPEFKAEAGFKVQFLLGRDTAHQYTHLCEVTEVIEGRKLTYSWQYEGYAGYSLVSFELFPEGGKTRLKLTHTITEPFPADNPDFAGKNFAEGWTYTANALQTFVENN